MWEEGSIWCCIEQHYSGWCPNIETESINIMKQGCCRSCLPGSSSPFPGGGQPRARCCRECPPPTSLSMHKTPAILWCDNYHLSLLCEADTNPLIFSPLRCDSHTQLRPTPLLSLPTDTLRKSPGRRSWPAQPRVYDCNQSDHQEEDSQSQEGQASSKLISE